MNATIYNAVYHATAITILADPTYVENLRIWNSAIAQPWRTYDHELAAAVAYVTAAARSCESQARNAANA